ncbi:hypothetical protein ACFLXA_04655 [Chloroflexota bacterium]
MDATTIWKSTQIGDKWQIQTQQGGLVATLEPSTDSQINAKLIAASPYMLEALKAVVDLIGEEDLPDNGELSGAAICDMVRAAVSLATE